MMDKVDNRKMRVQSESMIHKGHSYDFVDLEVVYKDGVVRSKPMVRHRGAATILPLLQTNEGLRIVVIRNERVTIDSFLLELPAGGIDENEEPISAAARELIEETGYKAGSMRPLCQFYTTPGLTDELMHVFIASDLEFVGQQLEPYESMTVELMRVDQLLEMLDSGQIMDGKTMVAIHTARSQGVFNRAEN